MTETLDADLQQDSKFSMKAALSALGIDVQLLISHLPDAMAVFATEPENASIDDLNAILIAAEKQTGDPHIGITLARQSPNESSLYSYLLSQATSLSEFLEISSKYYATLMRNGAINVSHEHNQIRIEYKQLMLSKFCSRHDNECSLAIFVLFIQSTLDAEWYPTKVSFSNAPPPNLDTLQTLFGTELQFNQPSTYLLIEASLLAEVIKENDKDSALTGLVRNTADKLLSAYVLDQSFETQARLLILKNLESPYNNAAAVATELGMSLSTFKRRLQHCGRSFRGLREDIVLGLAKQALAETQSQISNIALMLGYSELSAFDRAFSRLEGITPRDYRQLSQV